MAGRQAQGVSLALPAMAVLIQSSTPVPTRHQLKIIGSTPVPGRCAVPIG
jgi:hypothetical protein